MKLVKKHLKNKDFFLFAEGKPWFLFLIISLFALTYVAQVSAQMKIDSTSKRTPYGPRNTKFTKYSKVLALDSTFFALDTLPTRYSRFEHVDILKRKYQDTGNLGSALHSIFIQKTEEIGMTAGYNAYDKYFLAPDSTRFFDTKSPYTKLNIFFAGENRNKVDVKFSRSVNKRWSFGFDVQSFVAAKQINAKSRVDLNVEALSYSFQTRYETKNKRYTLLSSFNRTKHLINEHGGLVPKEINPKNEYFGYNSNAITWTSTAIGVFNRVQWRLYHHFNLFNGWFVFHQLDAYRKTNTYEDTDPKNVNQSSNTTSTTTTDTTTPIEIENKEEVATLPFYRQYPNFFLRNQATFDENTFLSIDNKIGLIKRTTHFYYQGYLKHRRWNNEFSILPNLINQDELYLGGEMKYFLKKSVFTINGEIGNQNQFIFNGSMKMPWIEITFQSSKKLPPLLFNHQLSLYDIWDNNFGTENKNFLSAKLSQKFSWAKFNLLASLVAIDNPLIFGFERRPIQPNLSVVQSQYGLEWDMFFAHIHWSGSVLFTNNIDNQHLIPAPEIFTFNEIYFDKTIFKGVMKAQIGFQIHFKTDYYAKAYDPRLQSFYLQNQFEVQGYPVIDFFWRFRVRNATAMIKLVNLRQLYEFPREGYFSTPFYTGVPYLIDIGFGWMFFD